MQDFEAIWKQVPVDLLNVTNALNFTIYVEPRRLEDLAAVHRRVVLTEQDIQTFDVNSTSFKAYLKKKNADIALYSKDLPLNVSDTIRLTCPQSANIGLHVSINTFDNYLGIISLDFMIELKIFCTTSIN